MAFRKFLSALGVSAPSVETVVENPRVGPGGTLRLVVTAVGGGADVDIERVRLDVVVRAEDLEYNDKTAWEHPYTVVTVDLDGFRLPAGETVTVRGEVVLPWEMPLTHALGAPITGGRAAVRTELEVDKAVDQGDFDEIEVHALPAQDAILQAYTDLGFRLREAEVKIGFLPELAPRMESRQTESCWQEIDFFFPESVNWGLEELETVLIAREDSLDAHPGGFPPATFVYDELDQQAWTEKLEEHVRAHWQPAHG
ncbi:sporulation protein [Streptomyces sp. NBC_01264]|uniref:sporulation protein n=1 Tax=Streptomyces sp. NBC_01264 TaxID=2903804 RepID=UPI0022527BE5|nr:sporulation protein [Streptomyces sp. NBC_01264]MCX4780310.1 sporulation protein [Streptomyces sp. NBC_01264]